MNIYLQLPLYTAKSNNILPEWRGNWGINSQVMSKICSGADDQTKMTVDSDTV